MVHLKQSGSFENQEGFLYDLRHNEENHDVRIVCKDDKIVSTSSLLFVLTSNYCKRILSVSEELPSSSENFVIFLKDYMSFTAQLLIEYMSTGSVKISSDETFRELKDLVRVLEVNSMLHKVVVKKETPENNDYDCNDEDDNFVIDTSSRNSSSTSGSGSESRSSDENDRIIFDIVRAEYDDEKREKSLASRLASSSPPSNGYEEIISNLENGEISTSYKCKKCSRIFAELDEMRQHYMKEYPTESWHCTECEMKIKNRTGFMYHMNHHADIVNGFFVCKVCGKQFSSTSGSRYSMHMKSHREPEPDPIPCEFCGKLLKDKRTLQTHIKLQHDLIGKPFECSICHKKFRTKGNLRLHGAVHSDKRAFVCDKCGFSSKTKMGLNQHLTIHYSDLRKFQCDTCGKSYATKGLLRHHQNTHQDLRLFSCSVCGKDFKTELSLKGHKFQSHGQASYKCTICSTVFKNLAAVKDHLIIHTDTKPFECLECMDKFKHREALRRHTRSKHSDKVKPQTKFRNNPKIQELIENAIIKMMNESVPTNNDYKPVQ